MKVIEAMLIGSALTSTDYNLDKRTLTESPSTYLRVDNHIVSAGHTTNFIPRNPLFLIRALQNKDQIMSFKELKEGWNGYSGQPISTETINRAVDLVLALNPQPEVFPTGRGSVQFDYFRDDDNLLEIEIFEGHYEMLEIKAGNETSNSNISPRNLKRRIKAFYA